MPSEPTIRRVVAERLGVGADDLYAGVSLRDDLAADSLDLVELMLALEAALAVGIPDVVAERVRTYGDLVVAIDGLLADGPVPPTRAAA